MSINIGLVSSTFLPSLVLRPKKGLFTPFSHMEELLQIIGFFPLQSSSGLFGSRFRVSASSLFPSLPFLQSSELVGPKCTSHAGRTSPPTNFFSKIVLSKLNVSSNK